MYHITYIYTLNIYAYTYVLYKSHEPFNLKKITPTLFYSVLYMA